MASYFGRVLRGATFRKAGEVIDSVQKRTGRCKAGIALDIFWCFLRYGAGYKDYDIFELYLANAKERATYMTRLKNHRLIEQLNDQKYAYIFDQKNVFDEYFAKYLGREVIDLAKTDLARFTAFLKGKDVIFAKPYDGESGKGIERLVVADYKDAETLFHYVKDPQKHFGVAEQAIVQHEAAAKIYPCSINCFRIVTIVWKGVPHILYAVFKMGNGARFIDNLDNGGIACHFDLDKGEICGRGHTSQLICYDAHPYTGVPFVGYKLPYMDEVKALVKEVALVVPQIRYVGWDVCLTPTGPIIIEGNDFPGYDFPQLPDPDKPRFGLLGMIRKEIPDFRL